MEHAEAAPVASYGPADFAQEFGVSGAAMERLGAFDARLVETAAHTNLVARSTLAARWERHYRDSAQLWPMIPQRARTLVDLGSGAGFPGLVLAALGADAGLRVWLVESTGKKAAFLAAAAADMRLQNVSVLCDRIENIVVPPPDVVTARALAPLDRLLSYAHRIAGPESLMIFPKGQDVADELTSATKCWHMDVVQRPSRTEAAATVLLVRNLRPKAPGSVGAPSSKRRKRQ